MQFVKLGLRSVLSGDSPARRLVLALVLELVALFLGWGRDKERLRVSLSRYSERKERNTHSCGQTWGRARLEKRSRRRQPEALIMIEYPTRTDLPGA